jgi:hypothetical protein
MSRVSFEVPPDQKVVLVDQARSLGVSLATYARNLVLDGSKRDRQGQQAELLRAIRAVVPVMIEAIGRTQKFPPDLLQEWIQTMLARYEKARTKP